MSAELTESSVAYPSYTDENDNKYPRDLRLMIEVLFEDPTARTWLDYGVDVASQCAKRDVKLKDVVDYMRKEGILNQVENILVSAVDKYYLETGMKNRLRG